MKRQRAHHTTNALNELLDTDYFNEVDADSIVLIGTKLDSSGETVRIEFIGNRIDLNTVIYKVEGISHWIHLTGKPTLMEYSGDKYVMYNYTSDCLRGLKEINQNEIRNPCTNLNERQGKLISWKEIAKGDPWENPAKTVAIESWPHVAVYCFTLNITIGEETEPCPNYPFKVYSTMSWNTSDGYHFHPYQSLNLTVNEKTWEVAWTLPKVHINETLKPSKESEMIKRIVELNKEVTQLERAQFAVKTAIGGLSYSGLAKTSIAALFVLSVALIGALTHLEKRGQVRHAKLLTHIENHSIKPPVQETVIETKTITEYKDDEDNQEDATAPLTEAQVHKPYEALHHDLYKLQKEADSQQIGTNPFGKYDFK